MAVSEMFSFSEMCPGLVNDSSRLIRWCKYIYIWHMMLLKDNWSLFSHISDKIFNLKSPIPLYPISISREDWQLTQRNKVVNRDGKVSALIGLFLQSSLVISLNCSNCLYVTEVGCNRVYEPFDISTHSHSRRNSNRYYNSNSTSGRQIRQQQHWLTGSGLLSEHFEFKLMT